MKWVSRWVSPGGGAGAAETQVRGWSLRRWWCYRGLGKMRGKKLLCVGGGEERSEDEASGDGKGHRGVGDEEGDRGPWE